MAWLDTCRIDANKQIDHRKEKDNISIRKSFSVISKESGIPIGTLRRWYYPSSYKPKEESDLKNEIVTHPTCAISDIQNLIDNNKKFSTIYADPPWKYSNQATRSATDNHYDTMTVEEIANLPIPKLTTENAHLHLWTTNAFLFESIKIIEAWGFQYKSIFVWVKPQMGIGNYWRVSHELMLFGLKGKQPFLNRSQKSWKEFNRTKHSAKPREMHDIIELVSPGEYIELFGRETVPGWTVWGNEIERTLFNKEAFNERNL